MKKDKERGGRGQLGGLRNARAGVPNEPVLHSQPLAVVSAADHKPGDLCTKCSSACTNVLNMAMTSMRSV